MKEPKSMLRASQNLSAPLSLQGLAGAEHSLYLTEQNSVFLDGQQVESMECQSEALTFHLLPPGSSPICCSPESLWEAVAGANVCPSVQDAGCLLGQLFASRLTFQRIHSQLVQHACNTLGLPPYREQFAPFIEDFLTRCNGTVEDLEAIARVGDVPLTRLLRWAAQHGKEWPCPPAITGPLQNLDTTDDTRVTEGTALMSEKADVPENQRAHPGSQEYFSWTDERIQALTQAFFKSTGRNVHAACVEIAAHFGWPAKKVEYKVYHLKLPEQKLQQQDPLPASDPESATASDVAIHAAVTSELVRHQEEASTPSRDLSHLGSPLLPPFSATEGVNNGVATDLTEVIESLDVSATSENNTPVHLEVGPHVWTVKIDGRSLPQQWRLCYAYSTFPESLQGKEVRYGGSPYRLERVYTSQLNLSSLVAISSH